MNHPQRIQLCRTKGWRIPANTVHCARPSALGNPFIVGVDGDAAECVARCRDLLGGWIQTDARASRVQQMLFLKVAQEGRQYFAGKSLACWCVSGPCHGDALLEFFNPELSAA